MEKFNALPLSHKALIVFVVMATIAGLFHFVLIGEIEGEMAAARGEIKKSEKKLSELKQYENPDLMAALEEEIIELNEQLAANKALLPEAEQIPTLITSIKAQADDLGLKIIRFEKGERYIDDYVAVIPVLMEVESSFPTVVAFYEALAAPGMRMMTVSQLRLKGLPLQVGEELSVGYPTVKSVAAVKDTKSAVQMSPVEQFIKRLDDYEASVRRMRIAATFTVNAFTYTGELLSEEEREARKRKRKKRH